MPELVAIFAFERLNSQQYPEDERYGEASIRISTDKEPESQEDFDEIAKAIFKKGGYAAVAVKSVFYDDEGLFNHLEKPDPVSHDKKFAVQQKKTVTFDEVIQGEVVDE